MIDPESHAGEIVARLTALLGRTAVSAADARDAAFDALGSQRGFASEVARAPICVAYPRSTDDVAAIVRLAAETGMPVVPYGAGSGLMGGARTVQPGIVVNLERMAAVRAIDAVSRVAWVEAGAVLKDIDDAVRAHGLMIGHDPWTYSVATVGGAISTNGLGFLGGKYGSMGDQVIAVEAVMSDGSCLQTRAVQPRSVGFDLSRLFVGGEGEFGIVTAAAIRLFPIPEARRRIGFTFPSFARGFEAVLALDAAGIASALLDYGERPEAGGPGWTREPEPPTLYIGFDGLREEVDALLSRSADLCTRHDARTLGPAAVDEFWDERHAPAENFARTRAARHAGRHDGRDEKRCFDYVHVSLPPSRVLGYRELALGIARERDVHVLEAGIWVHPGLFSLAMACDGVSHDDAVARMSDTVDSCVRAAHAVGGSMEYCHGVGVRLAHLMREEHGAGLDVMRALKRAFDPAMIMNPGKLSLD